jgi:hypothetical protein
MRRLISAVLGSVLFFIFFAQAAQSGGKTILLIGDSNTEFGYYSTALMDTLQSYYGVKGMGPGYIPMDSSFNALQKKNYLVHKDTVSIRYPVTTWTKYDMFEGTRLSSMPYLSGNGQWLKSTTVGAIDSVIFLGTGVDVYWLADSLGGSFSIAIDGVLIDTVSTKGTRSSQKTIITGLTVQRHTMLLKVLSASAAGPVILQGFDSHTDMSGHSKRSLVHNWGNGYCATLDFVRIDSTIFVTALQQLAPDVVVILLGTNDYGIDSRSAAEFKTFLKVIINRVKAANINSGIMLVSAFNTLGADTVKAKQFLPQYKATSWPEAASECGVEYWDMNTWFTPYVTTAYMSGVHIVNAAGGKILGNEMLNQILKRFTTPIKNPVIVSSTKPSLAGVEYHPERSLLIVKGTAHYSLELISLNGARVAHVSSSTPHTYTLNSGEFSVPAGVYYLRVCCAGKSAVWSVPVLR